MTDKIINIAVKESIIKSVSSYGVEGTEDAIKRVYTQHKKLREYMLSILYEMYYGEKK